MKATGPARHESRSFRPWSHASQPKRILLVRFHALGDVAVTLPSANALRSLLPAARIDFLTCAESAPLIRSLELADNVYVIPTRTPSGIRTIMHYGALARKQQYDLIIDLQRNRASRWIRRVASAEAWGEFDRFSPRPAAERALECFRSSGFTGLTPSFNLPIKDHVRRLAMDLLKESGWDGQRPLVVLNPAGLWPTRNWPLANYASLARLWQADGRPQFVFLGTERIRIKTREIAGRIGRDSIDLTCRTDVAVAFAVVSLANIIVTEDSGLMHMAWAAGVPTVALFGSTNHFQSSPTGRHVSILDSGDLPCGDCMDERCRIGDVPCLTRRTPDEVYHAAVHLLSRTTAQGVAP